MLEDCNTCKKDSIPHSKFNFGFVGSIILAILPKCPFCILAFTSTIILCNENKVVEMQSTHLSIESIIIASVFSLLIIIGLILNLSTVRSRYALAIACFGILMLMFSLIRSGEYELYYFGVSFVFLAVLLNVNPLRIFEKLKKSFSFLTSSVNGNPYS